MSAQMLRPQYIPKIFEKQVDCRVFGNLAVKKSINMPLHVTDETTVNRQSVWVENQVESII